MTEKLKKAFKRSEYKIYKISFAGGHGLPVYTTDFGKHRAEAIMNARLAMNDHRQQEMVLLGMHIVGFGFRNNNGLGCHETYLKRKGR